MRRLPKSRYASISAYISEDLLDNNNLDAQLNDNDLPINETVLQRLQGEGVDEVLARHVAHYWTRDPLVVFEERLEVGEKEKDHWENINSMNWQTVRLKPPPGADSGIGWRTEVRPCEISLTDYENAAFSSFIVLLTQAAEKRDYEWRVPISLLDE